MDNIGNTKKRKVLTKIGIVLILLSVFFYLFILAVPLLPLSVVQKGLAVTILITAGEIAWWAGFAILGKKVYDKYKKYFNPRNWFSRTSVTPK